MSAGEFSRLVKLDRLADGRVEIEADPAERAALAQRFVLPSIEALRAELSVARDGGAVEARGTITARFHQRCAVANEPFANRLAEPIALRFVPAGAAPGDDEELEFDADGPDEIEYDGGAFDLGEAVAQSFGLLLDPFAAGPDADRVRREAGIVDERAPSGPFAALAALKRPD